MKKATKKSATKKGKTRTGKGQLASKKGLVPAIQMTDRAFSPF